MLIFGDAIFINQRAYNEYTSTPYLYNIFKIKRSVVNRGNSGIKKLKEVSRPPMAWFDLPKKNGELGVIINKVELIGGHIEYNLYIITTTLHRIHDSYSSIEDIIQKNKNFIVWV